VTTLIVLAVASMAGYSLARLPFRGRSLFLGGILSSAMIPFQVLLIPFFILMTTLRLVNTPGGLVLAYLVLYLPFSVFMFRAYFLELPREIEESARIDGCSWLGVWWRIALPTARPAIATVGIYTFIESWNEFFLALVLTNSQTMRTLPVGLAMLRNDVVGISWGEMMASSLMAGAPAMIVFIILQRQLIAGLTGGAVKG
jgi:ABC-type glycerol-3-phosphate transport system permease component